MGRGIRPPGTVKLMADVVAYGMTAPELKAEAARHGRELAAAVEKPVHEGDLERNMRLSSIPLHGYSLKKFALALRSVDGRYLERTFELFDEIDIEEYWPSWSDPIRLVELKPRAGRPFSARWSGFCPICGEGWDKSDKIAKLQTPIGRTLEGQRGWPYKKYYKYAHDGCTFDPDVGDPNPQPADRPCELCERSHVVAGEIIFRCEDVPQEESNG